MSSGVRDFAGPKPPRFVPTYMANLLHFRSDMVQTSLLLGPGIFIPSHRGDIVFSDIDRPKILRYHWHRIRPYENIHSNVLAGWLTVFTGSKRSG